MRKPYIHWGEKKDSEGFVYSGQVDYIRHRYFMSGANLVNLSNFKKYLYYTHFLAFLEITTPFSESKESDSSSQKNVYTD